MTIATSKPSPFCPYCGKQSKLVTGKQVYPHLPQLGDKYFYLCKPCDAYVGCHRMTAEPKGTLAKADLRAARKAAHLAFDPHWQSGKMSRGSAYKRLTAELHRGSQVHIGQSDIETCRRIIAICKDWSANASSADPPQTA
jgi:hypothetical protein